MNATPVFEPTQNQIAVEMSRTGLDFPTARDKVAQRLAAEFEKIQNLAPVQSNKISKAVAAAKSARAEAEAALDAGRTVSRELEQNVFELGRARWQIALVKGIALSEAAAASLANQVLDDFLMDAASSSPASNSAVRGGVFHLVNSLALTPFVPAYVAALESKVAKLVQSIQNIARTQKVNLVKVLSDLEKSLQTPAGQKRHGATQLAQFFAAGFLDDLK